MLKFDNRLLQNLLIIIEECSCSNFVEDIYGYGNCSLSYEKGPICYVNEPSNCTDLAFSSRVKKRYSWEACKKIPGNAIIIYVWSCNHLIMNM